jgi:hypothetical protein
MPQGKRKKEEELKARRGERVVREIGKRVIIRHTDKPKGNHEPRPEKDK